MVNTLAVGIPRSVPVQNNATVLRFLDELSLFVQYCKLDCSLRRSLLLFSEHQRCPGYLSRDVMSLVKLHSRSGCVSACDIATKDWSYTTDLCTAATGVLLSDGSIRNIKGQNLQVIRGSKPRVNQDLEQHKIRTRIRVHSDVIL